MSFRIEPATDELFAERARWRYPPPYDFYNDDGRRPLNPERFYTVFTEDGAIAGFYISPMKVTAMVGLIVFIVVCAFLFTNRANEWFSARGLALKRES